MLRVLSIITVIRISTLIVSSLATVSCSDDPSVRSIPCSILVLGPATGDILLAGEDQTITWTTTGSCQDSVRIDLYKDGNLVYNIQNGVTNSGSYSWTISDSQEYAIYG